MTTLTKLSRLEEEIGELRRLEQEIPKLRGHERKKAFETYRELILWLLKDEPIYLARYEGVDHAAPAAGGYTVGEPLGEFVKQGINDPGVPKRYSMLNVDKHTLSSVTVKCPWKKPKIEAGLPQLDPELALLLKSEISPANRVLFYTFMRNDKTEKHVTRVMA